MVVVVILYQHMNGYLWLISSSAAGNILITLILSINLYNEYVIYVDLYFIELFNNISPYKGIIWTEL